MYAVIIAAFSAGFAAAAPSSHITARQTVQCSLTGWNRGSNAVNLGSGGSTWVSTTSSSGFDLGAEGHDGPLWSCSFGSQDLCNPDAMSGQVLPSDMLRIDQNLEWYPRTDGCMCSYMGYEYTGTTDGEVFTGVLYNEGTNRCTCQFPCIPRE